MITKFICTYDAIEDALENGVPSISKIAELVCAQLTGTGKTFAYELEHNDAQDYEDDENKEERVAGEEYVGDFDASHKSDSLDTLDNNRLGGPASRCAVGAGEEVT